MGYNNHTICKRDLKKGTTWATILCGKLIDITNLIWTIRKSFEHDKKLHGIWEIEDIQLKAAVKRQYVLGVNSLHTSDTYLFCQSRLELWAQKWEYIRAWLATVLIARGDFEAAQTEMKNQRGDATFSCKRATRMEINEQVKCRKNASQGSAVYSFT